MGRTIGLDFDGTLVDSRARHAAALLVAAEELGVPLPEGLPARFVVEKSSGLRGADVLALHGVPRAPELAARWTAIVEDLQLQELDQLYPDVIPFLNEKRTVGSRFVIATARQNAGAATSQASRFGLLSLIDGFFVVDPLQANVGLRKADSTRHLGISLVIGDTESDLQWAQCLDAKFSALDRGFRSSSYWRSHDVEPYPDLNTALNASGSHPSATPSPAPRETHMKGRNAGYANDKRRRPGS